MAGGWPMVKQVLKQVKMGGDGFVLKQVRLGFFVLFGLCLVCVEAML